MGESNPGHAILGSLRASILFCKFAHIIFRVDKYLANNEFEVRTETQVTLQYKTKGNAVPMHDMKTYSGSVGTAPLILSLRLDRT